jgi:hypothetical protein
MTPTPMQNNAGWGMEITNNQLGFELGGVNEFIGVDASGAYPNFN